MGETFIIGGLTVHVTTVSYGNERIYRARATEGRIYYTAFGAMPKQAIIKLLDKMSDDGKDVP